MKEKTGFLFLGLLINLSLLCASNATAEQDVAEVQAHYEKIRPELIAGYQKSDNPWVKAYTDWKATATAPANPGVHAKRYLMTYVNDIGHADYVKYASSGVEMPVGTVIAKESYKRKGKNNEGIKAGPLFFMEKVGLEKAPEYGGWVYSVIKPNGDTKKTSQKFCHSCHQAYASQDSLGYPAPSVRFATASEPPEAKSIASAVEGDAEKGKAAFASCGACHQMGPGAKNGVGPGLHNVFGRVVGSTNFAYSDGLKTLSTKGVVWNQETLDAWLAGPTAYLKSTLSDQTATSKMPLNFSDPQFRADIIAYLKAQAK